MKKYIFFSFIVGIMEAIEAIVYITNGAINIYDMLATSIELLWFFVSAIVFFQTKHRPTRFLASIFIIYFVIGILEGILLPSQDRMHLPLWIIIEGGIFGLAYAASSMFILYKLKKTN